MLYFDIQAIIMRFTILEFYPVYQTPSPTFTATLG
ncbi:unnamed protein product [Schistosoma curassoni]|uniref:Uncharacterized protein n=1 Tax=Schistosoma curassoni TaxID=6186 RepID=A0A183K3F5_9TREM|nr:unnamed protein product [Schistosoma curassoni]